MNIEFFKKIMKEKKITYEDLAEKAGLSISTIKKIFSGIAQYPRIDTVQAIEKALGLDDYEERIKAIGGFPVADKYAIPLVAEVACGKPVETNENIEGYVYIDFPHPEEYFALRVHGDSMTGAGITPKSILIVHKQNYADNGDIVVACIDGESTIKRFHRNGDITFLMPENSAYSPIPVTEKNEFYIFGKVVQIRTNL